MLRRCMITLLEEQLDNMGEENYKYSRNYTDKIVDNLLNDESLLKLAL